MEIKPLYVFTAKRIKFKIAINVFTLIVLVLDELFSKTGVGSSRFSETVSAKSIGTAT